MNHYNAKVEEGNVKIDVETLFYSLDDVAKTRVAKFLAFDERLVECVVKWLTKGRVKWDNPDWDAPGHDDQDQDWHVFVTGNKAVLEDVRRLLLTKRDEVVSRLVGDLAHGRDIADWEAEQWRSLCWYIQNRWHDKEERPKDRIDYENRPRRLTEDEVAKLIAAKAEEIRLKLDGHPTNAELAS